MNPPLTSSERTLVALWVVLCITCGCCAVLFGASGCGPPPPSEVEQLRARVGELEAQLAACGAGLESCTVERRFCLTQLEGSP